MMMENLITGSMAMALGVVLMPGVSAHAAFLEDFESAQNDNDLSSTLGWTPVANGEAYIKFGRQIDPDGFCFGGNGDWVKWNVVSKDTGVTAQPGQVTVFSCDASVCPPADGPGGHEKSSFWGYFGVRETVEWNNTVRWRVLGKDVGDPQQGWSWETMYVNETTEETTEYIPGYLGTYDEQNGVQELVVRLEIWLDRVNNEVWGTIDDGVTKTTTVKSPITRNADISVVNTGGLTANTGYQTAEGLDVDNIRAFVVGPTPGQFTDIVVVNTTASLEFQSELNEVYRLEYSTPPNSDTWIDTGLMLTGDGNLMTFSNATGSSTSRTYRIVWEQ